MTKRKGPQDYKGTPVAERPWSALTQSQRDDRLDALPWHEREIYQKLLASGHELTKMRAERATQLGMKYMIATVKAGGDPAAAKPKHPPRGSHPKKSDVASPATPKHKNLDRLFDLVRAASAAPDGRAAPAPNTQPASDDWLLTEVTPAHGTTPSEGTTAAMRTFFDHEQIRTQLTVNGRLRLDPEAILIYRLAPSFFSIGLGFRPEPWQADILDSYAIRLGVLASRQSGKSLTVAYKNTSGAVCEDGTTRLIIGPTLRQSSEALLKCAGVLQRAGLKIAQQSQFQIVLADRQPGAGSRIIALPGSSEDEGASVRGYTADSLTLEEAAFLSNVVIQTVMPSIAARPKAQLMAISSAGILAGHFHSVMTDPASGWEKHTIPASRSGRFSRQQLDELRTTLGGRFDHEMECVWSSLGDGLYSEDVFTAAFGQGSVPLVDPQPDLGDDAAYNWLDLDDVFTARIA